MHIDAKKTELEKAAEVDAEILEAIKSRRKLASDMELAKGISYTESLTTRYDSLAPLSTLSLTGVQLAPAKIYSREDQ